MKILSVTIVALLLSLNSAWSQAWVPPFCSGANAALQYTQSGWRCATITGTQGPAGPQGPAGVAGPAGLLVQPAPLVLLVPPVLQVRKELLALLVPLVRSAQSVPQAPPVLLVQSVPPVLQALPVRKVQLAQAERCQHSRPRVSASRATGMVPLGRAFQPSI